MQITWFFGNGLDLSFNYKTSYVDFFEYLIKNESKFNLKDNIIFSYLKKDCKTDDEGKIIFDEKAKDWVNFETKLGKITHEMKNEDIDVFKESKLQVDDLLKLYLKEITSIEIELSSEQKGELLIKSISHISNLSRVVDNDKIKDLLEVHRNEWFNLQSVSFNYTNTVSLLWERLDNYKNIKFFNMYPEYPYCIDLIDPFYIHGTLENDEMVIGVNDDTQILNDIFSKNILIQECLIKNTLLEISGQRQFNIFSDIVNKTSLFCLYGLSIGETDKNYWILIKNRLLNSDSLMILYSFKEIVPEGITRKRDMIKEIKNIFYLSSEASKEEIEQLDNKIIVEINANIFGNLYKK